MARPNDPDMPPKRTKKVRLGHKFALPKFGQVTMISKPDQWADIALKQYQHSRCGYKAFILPHFHYCSSVWHFCGARNTEKLDALNKRSLRFILNDVESTYSTLLNQVNCVSLYNKRIHNMLILLYKSLFLTKYPIYMRNMFTFRTTSYNLRGNYILALPVPKTTSYGLRSFSYHAVKLWNSLPDSVRTLNLTDFKKALAALKLM